MGHAGTLCSVGSERVLGENHAIIKENARAGDHAFSGEMDRKGELKQMQLTNVSPLSLILVLFILNSMVI